MSRSRSSKILTLLALSGALALAGAPPARAHNGSNAMVWVLSWLEAATVPSGGDQGSGLDPHGVPHHSRPAEPKPEAKPDKAGPGAQSRVRRPSAPSIRPASSRTLCAEAVARNADGVTPKARRKAAVKWLCEA
jgi:hypothetical protein